MESKAWNNKEGKKQSNLVRDLQTSKVRYPGGEKSEDVFLQITHV